VVPFRRFSFALSNISFLTLGSKLFTYNPLYTTSRAFFISFSSHRSVSRCCPIHRARCLALLLPLKKISLRGVPHAGRVAPTLYRGAPPGFARARRAETLGVITFINLRAESTHTGNLERSDAESLGIRFVHIPVGEFSTPSSGARRFFPSSPGHTPVTCFRPLRIWRRSHWGLYCAGPAPSLAILLPSASHAATCVSPVSAGSCLMFRPALPVLPPPPPSTSVPFRNVTPASYRDFSLSMYSPIVRAFILHVSRRPRERRPLSDP
jgi:hypothetical protein